MKNCFRFIFLFFFLVSIDQFLKFIFLEESICNKNLAWSIPIASGVFYFFWLIVFFFLIYYFLKSENYFERTALALTLSGSVSNLIDRIIHGCVIDFIDLKLWPVFNSADIYITIGVFWLIIIYIKIKNTRY
jgi:signal peptidase II